MGVSENQRGGDLLAASQRFERKPGIFARLLAPGFHKLLDKMDEGIARGAVLGRLPDGSTRLLGGRSPGFEAEVTIHNWRALVRVATGGSVGWYQAWEAGEWSSPDSVPLFALFMQNALTLGDTARAKGGWKRALRSAHGKQRNTRKGAEKNISAHYDLGNDFYAAWLGETMTYSAALFDEGSAPQTLNMAQRAKIDAILDRVALKPGDTLLEIGCGWGTLARAAADRGAKVDAISLSEEQLAWARRQSVGDARFLYQDYRDTNGQYDAIASVEMVEALGREYWPTFMDCVARNLKPGGRAAIQFIAIDDALFDSYAASADFIQAYIFPGGLLIRASEFRALGEERGLRWTDEKRFGIDYAETLRLWREAFDRAAAESLLPEGFDERFRALWRYYLMYCEGGFRGGGIDVYQVTLVKER
ncbi:cyclopropane-fatty-acyl-phospholipid synthase [Citromicrobium sp. RCC1885]|uniref:SAM-dependent methyltransferase n=1 Tax=unclassified Citromicrobium TaxID=2630544 RepID=UPI0006C914BB|nr:MULTISPECIES: cyclopropane-fatty-acyl-phospholipid synthase family protein [unclassified Citromicrobium]KPM25284.1 cyclopropane-fatty-acyl-phospholipid synthase [Citromicrobium sp. RCC1885]KPM28525.1 cyclopropane-fatty-acyl-phospholipid synthase [Citromicrobium sp. RCC1878]MAO02941.1 class I SAM-dependent methyltransferase [Citromicrobium sp.]OAM09935.1 cyclopropane-fatty-acyl-phospholipid synthase [Citromicrobium sp. RCC1897]|tara:strand:+ start:561 stop:1817 length:1257 start_codon:yes stop_codon:yes gene_type:complete